MQAAIPQVKIGAGSTAMCYINAPGCTIQGIGFNGASSTGGGIKIGVVPSGNIIRGCHFKNCKVSSTDGRQGGAIYWTSSGGGWQTIIEGNRFYKNISDIVLLGTGSSRPQDIIIRDNIFSGPAASVDVNIYTVADGIDGLIIDSNIFQALPNVGSGSCATFLNLTGCVGVLSRNMFGGSGEAFGAAQANVVPTGMMICGNYQDNALVGRT
jgi:hypothetical protein